MPPPILLTFDVFGTIVDWRAGLRVDLAACGIDLDDKRFAIVIADQAVAEQALVFLSYAEITALTVARRLGVQRVQALAIGAGVGKWPLYPDSREGLRALLAKAPCVALTNSDRAHGEQAQQQLGFRLTDWVCAEETRVYKPAPAFWDFVARKRSVKPGKDWWHVSAYADYDLDVARRLGLTTVFVKRPHAHPEPADIVVDDLAGLAAIITK